MICIWKISYPYFSANQIVDNSNLEFGTILPIKPQKRILIEAKYNFTFLNDNLSLRIMC